MGHTPGPWHVDGNSRTQTYVTDSADNVAVCRVTRYVCDGKQQEANARLIAASPELLEQVIEDGLTICRLCRRLNPQHAECDSCEDVEDRKKLIAKAKGET